jgi:hypothetical protein
VACGLTSARHLAIGEYMSYTCQELIDEVRAQIGREEDTVLITEERVLRWLNDAQDEICEQIPGIHELELKNTDSVDFTTTLSYPLADFTSHLADVTTENRICYVWDIFYKNGADSYRIDFTPTDEFDTMVIDPTHTDAELSRPQYWTRRGNSIEMIPLCLTEWCDKDIRLDGCVYPINFTGVDSTQVSSLKKADEGLISYAVYKAWVAIGNSENASMWMGKFNAWLTDYRDKNNVMHAWDANLYGGYV